MSCVLIRSSNVLFCSFRCTLPFLWLGFAFMLVTNDELAHERLVRNGAETTRVVRVWTLYTDQKHLIKSIFSAESAIMPRTSEHARMLLFISRKPIGSLLYTRHVIKASTVVLSTFYERFVDLIEASIRVDHASRPEERNELLDVVHAKPLLVEGEASLFPLPHSVSFPPPSMAEEALARLGDAGAALPFGGDLLQADAPQMELAAATARARHQLMLPVRTFFAEAAETHALDGRVGRLGQGEKVV